MGEGGVVMSCPNCGNIDVYSDDTDCGWFAIADIGYNATAEIKFCPFCGFELPEIPKSKEVSPQEFMDIRLVGAAGKQIAENAKPLKFRKFCDA